LIRKSTNTNWTDITLSTNQTGVTTNFYVALAAFSDIPRLDDGSNMLTECESTGMVRNQNGSLIDPEKYHAILKKRPADSFKELEVQHNLH